jgi:very-short-patch-repair endonuclease
MKTTPYSTRYHFYNNRLQPYANKLRKNGTKAEACLWKYVLSRRQMLGFQFRRQRPVLKYIADFACLDLKLIIEVDGSWHNKKGEFEKDQIRQQALEAAGFTVLRFKNEDVLHHIRDVAKAIKDWIIEQVAMP